MELPRSQLPSGTDRSRSARLRRLVEVAGVDAAARVRGRIRPRVRSTRRTASKVTLTVFPFTFCIRWMSSKPTREAIVFLASMIG